MRTTLTIDDDVLVAARAMAERTHRTLGEIVSELARRSIYRPAEMGERNGVPLLSGENRCVPVTLDLVNRLRDEAP